MIPYNALHTFHLAVGFGSLKRTAEHLCLTESAISHQLKRLEQQVGCQLLYKSGRQLRPTSAGQQLADRLRAPFADIQDAVDTLGSTDSHSLTLYCLPSLLDCWLLPRLIPFKAEYPMYDLEIRYLQSAPEHLNESALLICSRDKEDKTSAVSHTLLCGETLPVCSPIYLQQKDRIQSAEDLLHTDLLHDQAEYPWRDWFAEQGLTYDEKPHFLYEDFHLLKMATLAAQGVALCPISLIGMELENGQLVTLSTQRGNRGRRYVLEHSLFACQGIRELSNYLTAHL